MDLDLYVIIVIAVALVVVIVIAFIIFYKPITRLIDRISKASPDGIDCPIPQPPNMDSEMTQPLSFAEVMSQPVSASVLGRENIIENQLNEIKFSNDKEKITVLYRSLASSKVSSEFNIISSVIFGSQMDLLYNLSGHHAGVEKEQAEEFFTVAKTDFQQLYENREFKDWLSYLISNNLVSIHEEIIFITQYGTDFIKHLVDYHMVYKRHG